MLALIKLTRGSHCSPSSVSASAMSTWCPSSSMFGLHPHREVSERCTVRDLDEKFRMMCTALVIRNEASSSIDRSGT